MRAVALMAGVAASAVLMGACGSSAKKTEAESTTTVPAVQQIAARITEQGCEPAAITAKAGPATFTVANESKTPRAEFEVLGAEDNELVGEAEGIEPGEDGTFTVTLKPGEFKTLCPGGESGTLTVAGDSTATTIPLTGAAQQAVDDYRDYIREQASTLVTETQRFADAVKAGNIEAAKQLFPVARAPYERIEPVAEAFGDLDPQIDARDGDVPADEWGGFHKIEQALWEKNTTADMGAVADKLVADVKKLDAAIPKFELTPEGVANGAVELLNEVGTSKVTGEEDRYSHTDLYDFEANVEGAREALKVVTPIIAKKNAELAPQLNKEFAAVLTSLAKYKTGDTYKPYTDLTDADTKALGTQVDALADKLSAVPPLVVNS